MGGTYAGRGTCLYVTEVGPSPSYRKYRPLRVNEPSATSILDTST